MITMNARTVPGPRLRPSPHAAIPDVEASAVCSAPKEPHALTASTVVAALTWATAALERLISGVAGTLPPSPPAVCPSIAEIQAVVALLAGTRLTEMQSCRRARAVARPRQIAMTLAKELTPQSLPSIGRAFGGRDHTTVMHAVKAIAAQIRKGNREVIDLYEAAKGRLCQ